ncbi:MAG: hypothetical protein AB1629_07910 [Candidatus Omnitrophota bacterium]
MEQRLFFKYRRSKEICARKFKMTKIPLFGPGPAEYYQWEDLVVGFIKTSRDNCCSCNRLRLTSTGQLKTCLYEENGINLREILRQDSSDVKLKETIQTVLSLKPSINHTVWEAQKIYMCSLGG